MALNSGNPALAGRVVNVGKPLQYHGRHLQQIEHRPRFLQRDEARGRLPEPGIVMPARRLVPGKGPKPLCTDELVIVFEIAHEAAVARSKVVGLGAGGHPGVEQPLGIPRVVAPREVFGRVEGPLVTGSHPVPHVSHDAEQAGEGASVASLVLCLALGDDAVEQTTVRKGVLDRGKGAVDGAGVRAHHGTVLPQERQHLLVVREVIVEQGLRDEASREGDRLLENLRSRAKPRRCPAAPWLCSPQSRAGAKRGQGMCAATSTNRRKAVICARFRARP